VIENGPLLAVGTEYSVTVAPAVAGIAGTNSNIRSTAETFRARTQRDRLAAEATAYLDRHAT
jgi:hypothetical protein